MADKLKEFINRNKKAFDTEEPSSDLWNKIDSGMEVKKYSWISSKFLSNFKYLALSASVLLIVVYFITQKLTEPSSNEISQNSTDSARNNSGEWVKTRHSKSSIRQTEENSTVSYAEKKLQSTYSVSASKKSLNDLIQGADVNFSNDSVNQKVSSDVHSDNSVSAEMSESNANLVSDKKTGNIPSKLKKGKVNVPLEPEKVNLYTGTLFEGYSLCSVLRAYKFPGQVSMDEGGNYTTHRTLKTISCSRLEKTSNVKAVWVKGKTNRKMTVSIKEGFKNIVLIKSNGQQQNPVAISHYYQGLGVISDYSGKHFDMIFRDKVELILFFKEVEDGDKISIDGVIEAQVKMAP